MYCTNCGSNVADNLKFCENCGSPVRNVQNQAAFIVNPYQNIVSKLAGKVKINGVIWLIVGIVQVLISLGTFASEGFLSSGWLILSISMANINNAIQDFNYSKAVIGTPVGIVGDFQPLKGAIITLIYNILFGGVIGIAGSVYHFFVRSFVMNNSAIFNQIEEEYKVEEEYTNE